jgi:nucleoside-diphosphate-sugar epimerase
MSSNRLNYFLGRQRHGVALTGATGFIGSHILAELQEHRTAERELPKRKGRSEMTHDNEAIVLHDDKIETFNCYVGYSAMFAQMGVLPDFAAAVTEPTAAAEVLA